ncbi:MAG: hypothetical protein U0984_18965 [Prosthecobacter sp.]|nr:hypothetical protein [Prosthecobacter sp.]
MNSSSPDPARGVRIAGLVLFGLTAAVQLFITLFYVFLWTGWRLGLSGLSLFFIFEWIYVIGSLICFSKRSLTPHLKRLALLLHVCAALAWWSGWALTGGFVLLQIMALPVMWLWLIDSSRDKDEA